MRHTVANNAYESQRSRGHKRKAAACLVPAPRVQVARIVCGGRVPPAARDGDHPPVLERLHCLGPQLVAAQQIRPSYSCNFQHDLLNAELWWPATQVAGDRADLRPHVTYRSCIDYYLVLQSKEEQQAGARIHERAVAGSPGVAVAQLAVLAPAKGVHDAL